MTKFYSYILFIIILSFTSYSQIRIPLTNNSEIQSNSNIKYIPDDYLMDDSEEDGVVKIINKENITIDGDSVIVTGVGTAGYLFYIENSSNITIKNFEHVKNFYYSCYILNSDSITINGNNFSDNKLDNEGWILVWTGYEQALGGGVMMYQCNNSEFYDNIMTNQNDGIALYNSDNITIHDNDLSWNTAYGVRMYFTDNCYIHHNNCSHVNRWTDPSDCAAILLIVSNNNIVEYNDLTYSGDGIFLGQYEYSDIPNNNYFAYNDGSHSPHNAFEATFADGNVFVHNKANHSDYGFWLGYSFNNVVEDNEIMNNWTAGIAVDRGFNNTFTNNNYQNNPIGIWLWEGNPIPPYQDQSSHDYLITNSVFKNNLTAIKSSETERLILKNNEFTKNWIAVDVEGYSANDTIINSSFKNNIQYNIENNSVFDILATNNSYGINDVDAIECKIYDKSDNSSKGEVIFQPFEQSPDPQFEITPPNDLTEQPSDWGVFASDGKPTSLDWDNQYKQAGNEALKVTTQSGFDVTVNYWPADDKIASWNLNQMNFINVWFRTMNVNQNYFQNCFIRVGNSCGDYYEYTAPSSVLTSAINQWKYYSIPLEGNSTWQRSTHGNMDLSNVNYIQIHADTWGSGFLLWMDGLSFSTTTDVNENQNEIPGEFTLKQNYPNPFNPTTKIKFTVGSWQLAKGSRSPLERGQRGVLTTLTIYDILGNEVTTLVNEEKQPGNYEIEFNASNLSSGIYFYKLSAGNFIKTKKMIFLK